MKHPKPVQPVQAPQELQTAPPPQQEPANGVPPEGEDEGQAGEMPGMDAPMNDGDATPEPMPQGEENGSEDGGTKEDLQSQAGSLAAALRQYNSESPQPDVETNKYVAGMILSAAIENLSGKDRRDVVKKAKAGEDLGMEPEEESENPEK